MSARLSRKTTVKITLCIGVGLMVLLVVFLFNGLSIMKSDEQNGLVKIINIKTALLKKWQQGRVLENNLTYKSQGDNVVLLQEMLSQDSSIYPEKKITGYYDRTTSDAVRKFQKEYNLSETGEVDEPIRNKLNEIFFSNLCPQQIVVYPELSMTRIRESNPLPLDYIPKFLVRVPSKVKTAGVMCLRSEVMPQIVEMFSDAKRDGVELSITSGYRNSKIQKYLYDFWMRIEGRSAINVIARPGFSEHQLGVAVDLTDSSIGFAGVDPRFANSKGGKWMRDNAHKYGFTMSFPKGKQKTTGFSYEPWHWRFVGVDIATILRERGVAYNEGSSGSDGLLVAKNNIGELSVSASSFVSFFVSDDGEEKVLIEKNKNKTLPIASITKLMVALVASEKYRTNDVISISSDLLKDKGLAEVYHAGDNFSFSDAMPALLIGSHNEMANALAEKTGRKKFVDSMNKKAFELGLANTNFVNATGLDPSRSSDEINHSTVFDIYKLARYIDQNRPNIIATTSRKDFYLFNVDGNFVTEINSTNKLLGKQNIPFNILGGKTGETPRAKQNLVVIAKATCGGKIFSVVLGSSDSFGDMEKLLWYVSNSYQWSCKQ